MDIHTIALHLLIFRIVSVIFMGIVLYKQVNLFGTTIKGDRVVDFKIFSKIYNVKVLTLFRRVMFALASIIFIGQLVPILIDVATLFLAANRTTPNILGALYGYSNAFTAMVASIALWLCYKIAERSVKKED